jgi:hypothetical protein
VKVRFGQIGPAGSTNPVLPHSTFANGVAVVVVTLFIAWAIATVLVTWLTMALRGRPFKQTVKVPATVFGVIAVLMALVATPV